MSKQYEIILSLDDKEKRDKLEFYEDLEFLAEVNVMFQDKREKFHQFLQDITAFKCEKRIDAIVFKERANEVFKGNKYLILGFNYVMKDYQIKLSLDDQQQDHDGTGIKIKNVAENCQLPWDVLDIICRTLDFEDLFQFAGVCKNWCAFHKIFWRNFLESQEPLLVAKSSHFKKYFSFASIPHRKVYNSKMINNFCWHLAYCGSSSGYLIMTRDSNSFMLINPFTRRKMVINTSSFKVNCSRFAYRVLLAFGKGSEELVLVVLCRSSYSLHVYQSRNCGWVTYSTMGNPWVIDFAVLHNTIYVITNKGDIGVLSLNSANIKFLKLKSTPTVTYFSNLRLVSCDGQLLVVHVIMSIVYKIDFSTMNYVKLETLGDIALFHAPENSYALSNPGKWGYESNSLYIADILYEKCIVCVGDDNKMPKYRFSRFPALLIRRPSSYLLDWCFRHLNNEVDYSQVE